MKVLIVDDEVYAVNALINRVDWAGYGFDKPLSAHSMAQAQSVFLAVPVDLLLCDIEMPQGSGLDLFEWVKSYYPKTECIFVTCHDEYSYLRSAMQLGSCDYILKPVSYYAFSETMKRAAAKIRARGSDEDFLTVNVKGGVRRVEIGSILYVEVIDHDLYYHLAGEVIETRGTMRQVESELENYPFFKINKGLLINLAFVNGYFKSDVRVGGELLPVSRPRRKLLLEAVNSYLNRGV